MAIIRPSALTGGFSIIFNGVNTPSFPTGQQPLAGDLLLHLTGEFLGSDATPAAPTGGANTWTDRAPHNSSHQIAVYSATALGGGNDQLQGVNWGGGQWSWAIALALRGVNLVTVIDSSQDRLTNTTSDIVGPAQTLAQSVANGGGYALMVGMRDRTATTQGNVFTAPTGWNGMVAQTQGNGSALFGVGVAEWLNPGQINPNQDMQGKPNSDATNQAMQCMILLFKPSAGPLPGSGNAQVAGQAPSVVPALNSILVPVTA